jgi:hypothetical protein
LGHLRAVKGEDHVRFAADYGMMEYHISAKTKDSLQIPFIQIAGDCLGIDMKKMTVDTSPQASYDYTSYFSSKTYLYRVW